MTGVVVFTTVIELINIIIIIITIVLVKPITTL